MSVRDEAGDQLGKLAGEVLDGAIKLGQTDAIRLAHRVLERFPEMRKKHMFIAGGAALSSAVLIAAGVAIAKRIRQGQSGAEAAEDITEDELDTVSLLERRRRPLRDVTEEAAAATAIVDEDGHEPASDAPAASHG